MSENHGWRLDSYETLVPLDMPDWDRTISSYRSKHLFHEACWLRFLERSQQAKIHAVKLLDTDGALAGYFCAGETRKGFFRLLGSPLQGWTTNFIGPIVNQVHPEILLQTLDRLCRALAIDYFELCNPILPASMMREAGFELDADTTFLVTIDSETSMWGRLKSECRNRIRKGLKNGLRVEHTTDPTFVHEYYAQLQDVFLRQGRVPTYGKERVRLLWESLMPAGRLLALRVYKGNDVIATGVFPYDERAIYFWGGASWTSAYSLYPNELLHWNAMLFALGKGIPIYNMCGGGSFKPKFGGTQIVIERWFKTLSPLARMGRTAYKHYTTARQRVLGELRRTFAGNPIEAADK